jgi:hypothetical protein
MRYDTNSLTGTYSAFCRFYGYHNTEKAGTHNWNEEAIEQMTRDLAVPWQNLRSTLQRNLENHTAIIEELMDWVIEYLGKADANLFSADY